MITWDIKSKLLTDLEKYVIHEGKEVMVARLSSIAYKDKFEDNVFSHELPNYVHIMEIKDPENKQYSEMDPVEVTKFIFNAWKNEEWDKVRLFCEINIYIYYMRFEPLAKFRITGPKFKRNPRYPGYLVPYELIFKNGHVKKLALALRNDNKMKRYVIDGGL